MCRFGLEFLFDGHLIDLVNKYVISLNTNGLLFDGHLIKH